MAAIWRSDAHLMDKMAAISYIAFSNAFTWIKSLYLDLTSLMCIPKGPIEIKTTLVQVMAWGKQETSHHLNQCWLIHLYIHAVQGRDEL